jgi:hypothetical protein
MSNGEDIMNLCNEYDYENGEPVVRAILDHKSGYGKTKRELVWSGMKAQIALANQLKVPFLMSIDFMYEEETPCSFLIPSNQYAFDFFHKEKIPLVKAGGYEGVWLSPYHWCWVLHRLRDKYPNPKCKIDPEGKHYQHPELRKLMDKFNLVVIEDLPKKVNKNLLG